MENFFNSEIWQSARGWFDSAYAYLRDIWGEGAYGLTYGQIITATGIIMISLIIRGVFARTVVRGITQFAANTETQIDDALVRSVATPLKLVPVIIGVFVALQVIDVQGDVEKYTRLGIQSVIALSVFWTLSRAVGEFSFLFAGMTEALSSAVIDWLVKGVQMLLFVLGIGAVLDLWGIQIAPIIAGLGVLGIAIGLGAQDLFKNLISGILILTEERFEPGDWIQVDGIVEGTVEKINFRSTLVRRFDKSPVYVPNGILSDNAVTNFSRMTHRRIKWVVGVEYRTTVDQLRYIRDEIEAAIWNDERFVRPPDAGLFVRVDSFNDSSIDFLVYCFTHTTAWTEWLAIKEELAYAIMVIIKNAGTEFAFPSRTMYIQEQDPPEIMAPPAPSLQVEKARREREATGSKLGLGEADDAE